MYQLINSLLQPYTFLLLSLLGVLLWAWRREQPRRRLLSVALGLAALLCLLSLPIVGHLARGSLEWQYPPSAEVPSRDDTIVVLAGSTHITNREGTRLRLGDETMVRCQHAYDLYDRAGGCRIIVAGGIVDSSAAGMTIAEAMRDFLVALGVPQDDLVMESTSSTTFENVRNVCMLLREENQPRIFLVTSAFHMLRTERCFAKQETKVIPAPCNHMAVRIEPSPTTFIPSLSGIGGVQLACHEWLGIAWYRMRGRI